MNPNTARLSRLANVLQDSGYTPGVWAGHIYTSYKGTIISLYSPAPKSVYWHITRNGFSAHAHTLHTDRRGFTRDHENIMAAAFDIYDIHHWGLTPEFLRAETRINPAGGAVVTVCQQNGTRELATFTRTTRKDPWKLTPDSTDTWRTIYKLATRGYFGPAQSTAAVAVGDLIWDELNRHGAAYPTRNTTNQYAANRTHITIDAYQQDGALLIQVTKPGKGKVLTIWMTDWAPRVARIVVNAALGDYTGPQQIEIP